jgi:hypothetical protein
MKNHAPGMVTWLVLQREDVYLTIQILTLETGRVRRVIAASETGFDDPGTILLQPLASDFMREILGQMKSTAKASESSSNCVVI